MTDDDLIDFTPLVPLAELPPYFDPEPPAPSRRKAAPVSTERAAYGLVGVPTNSLRVRDVKTAVVGFSLGALCVGLLSWLGRRRV